ncbi:MAG: Holliday junction ATP-dependent DNA helicase RuvA [Candidatus Magasanikbacteria bacterium GW2011_GWA2_56_11]|uniref:Holliday junction branch migration complex subunit RuvA n=1 Tax=Candidatus Magasanikbacteria bacterium GW2011_GWA2_56_11 TaxID=1619044 RepID=A0A0G1YHP5_9BACT|nr:MAG: Holliday junction ATP-dependent DNA helicase RuvA [Candidatus Magasanikbacteria bacterium GW2011_GWA2_56_11]
MISFVRGTVFMARPGALGVLTASGVGYEIHLPSAQARAKQIGAEVSFYTYLRVSDQAQDLYGFETLEERDFFILLMTVSGVGPKSALNILSLGSMDNIKSAIARGDVKYLTAVQGMGKKTAERVVVELKSKISGANLDVPGEAMGGALGDVVGALVSMGYSPDEARQAAQELDPADKTSEELVREALRRLAR